MQNVHFTVGDLARIKVAPTVGPAVETMFAVESLERSGGGPALGRWREAVRARIHGCARTREALRLLRAARLRSDTWHGPGWVVDVVGDAREVPDRPGDRVAEALRRVHQVAVAPYWGRLRGYLDVDREHLARVLASDGIEGLFAALHARIRWAPPTLTVPSSRDRDLRLDGRGLVVVPSVFLDEPTVFADARRRDAQPVLVYPVSLQGPSAEALWDAPVRTDQALGALVGRTRAEVLRALTETRNTSELGRRLGISPAAASQHATVLREAGLITSRRKLNTMLHTLTALGAALVMGGGPEPGRARGEDREGGFAACGAVLARKAV